MSARGTGQKPDLVDQEAMAERLGVSTATVSRWQRRDVLPPPDLQVGTTDVWLWETVHGWAGRRGRSLSLRKPRRTLRPADVVDLSELADRLGVSARTAANWKRSGLLPDPDYRWAGTDAWLWETVDRWTATADGRVPGLARPVEPVPAGRSGEPGGPRLTPIPGGSAQEPPAAAPAQTTAELASPDQPIRPVANPVSGSPNGARDVTPARDRSADPIGDIDRIHRYFAAMADSWRVPARNGEQH